jgi:hypothetical protein
LFGWTDIQQTTAVQANALDYNGTSTLLELEGSSLANAVNALEVDVDLGGTSSTLSRVGMLIEVGGGTVVPTVRGTNFDAAISMAMDNAITGTGPSWKNGIVYGNPNGKWPFAADSQLIGAYGAAGNAGFGINWTNVAFAVSAIATPGFNLMPNGEVTNAILDPGPQAMFVGTNYAVQVSTDVNSAYVSGRNSANTGFAPLTMQGTSINLTPQGGTTKILNIPGSCSGLASGTLWNNGGVVNVC